MDLRGEINEKLTENIIFNGTILDPPLLLLATRNYTSSSNSLGFVQIMETPRTTRKIG